MAWQKELNQFSVQAPTPEQLAVLQQIGYWPSLGQTISQTQIFTPSVANNGFIINAGAINFNIRGQLDTIQIYIPAYGDNIGVAVSVDGADIMAPYAITPLPTTTAFNKNPLTFFGPGLELGNMFGFSTSQTVAINKFNLQIIGNPISGVNGFANAYFNLGIPVSQKIVLQAYNDFIGPSINIGISVIVQYHLVIGE